MKVVSIQCTEFALLSSASIPLFPRFVVEFGGVLEALLFQQISFLSRPILHDGEAIEAARISYTRLQKQIPSFSRRWIIRTVEKLRMLGVIHVVATKRVNLLAINGEYQFKSPVNDKNSSRMLVFPELLKRMSPLEAVALQQIHMRCVGHDGAYWFPATCNQLQSTVFQFVSLTTVTRVMNGLRKQELIYVRPHKGNEGPINSYRVNYLKVAELIGAQIPIVVRPSTVNLADWISPLYPLGSADLT